MTAKLETLLRRRTLKNLSEVGTWPRSAATSRQPSLVGPSHREMGQWWLRNGSLRRKAELALLRRRRLPPVIAKIELCPSNTVETRKNWF